MIPAAAFQLLSNHTARLTAPGGDTVANRTTILKLATAYTLGLGIDTQTRWRAESAIYHAYVHSRPETLALDLLGALAEVQRESGRIQ